MSGAVLDWKIIEAARRAQAAQAQAADAELEGYADGVVCVYCGGVVRSFDSHGEPVAYDGAPVCRPNCLSRQS